MPPDQHFNKKILEDEPRTPACSSKSTQKKTRTPELELEEYQLARDRLRRTINPPVRYAQADLVAHAFNSAYTLEYDEPRTYGEAMKSENKKESQQAMEEEICSLRKNNTWKLVERPQKKLVGYK